MRDALAPIASRLHRLPLRLALSLAILLVAGGLILALDRQLTSRQTDCLAMKEELGFSAPCVVIHFPGRVSLHSTWLWKYWAGAYLGFWSVFLTAFVCYPAVSGVAARLRRRWRAAYTVAALIAGVVGLAAFILYYGSRQFGAFDCGIVIDAGWRLLQGQILYQDFFSPMPPALPLGVKLAYRLWGVRWISILLVTAIFAGGTFLWLYYLFTELLGSRWPAFLAAFSIECVSMLLVGYWWYNNITSVTAAVFLLSCLCYLRGADRFVAQVSYAASLALLGFMKANTAAPLIVAGVVLLLFGAPRGAKVRVLLLTAAAAGANAAVLLFNNVSVMGLLSSYFIAAGERGLPFAYSAGRTYLADNLRAAVGVLVLCSAFLAWWPHFRRAVARHNRPAMAGLLLLVAAAIAGFLAMSTNVEIKDVDWPLLIAAGVLLLDDPVPSIAGNVDPAEAETPGARHQGARQWPGVARFFVCFLCAVTVTDLWTGAVRFRVYMVGPQLFFNSSEPLVKPGPRFFGGMQASPLLAKVLQQTAEVLRDTPRPVFFGPRMEFAYAVFGEPSPKDLGITWEPGTSFAKEEEEILEETWLSKDFRTVIFVSHDLTYYPDPFRRKIAAAYRIDNRWPNILVLRLKDERP